MKNHWHEQIQRYVDGQASAEEVAALQAALNENAELRALYLDYMNLDVALGAAAEAATIAENGIARITTCPRYPLIRHRTTGVGLRRRRVLALVIDRMLSRHRNPSPTRPDIAAVCSSTQEAIARLSVEPPSSFPAWASPTASMLDQPPTSKMGPVIMKLDSRPTHTMKLIASLPSSLRYARFSLRPTPRRPPTRLQARFFRRNWCCWRVTGSL